jgi:hypothetical protein
MAQNGKQSRRPAERGQRQAVGDDDQGAGQHRPDGDTLQRQPTVGVNELQRVGPELAQHRRGIEADVAVAEEAMSGVQREENERQLQRGAGVVDRLEGGLVQT